MLVIKKLKINKYSNNNLWLTNPPLASAITYGLFFSIIKCTLYFKNFNFVFVS